MGVTASPERRPRKLALAEDDLGPFETASWIGPLVTLGSRASRCASKLSGRQLIAAVSVPCRDFAAVLIGCGWVMASKAKTLDPPLHVLQSIEPGTPIRAVNEQHVIAGVFSSLNESVNPPRAQFAGSTWRTDRLRSVAPISPGLDASVKTSRPTPGSIGRLAGLDAEWDARLVSPAADLAIVGTMTWLKEDLCARLTLEGDREDPSSVSDLLLPNVGRVATWFTRIYASAGLADHLPLPADVSAAILDGAGAIKYLTELETPIVLCVIDRSVADETAAEIVVQLRNARGEPISIVEDFGWRAPAGVEALAYTVAL